MPKAPRHLTKVQREVIVSTITTMAAITLGVIAYYQEPPTLWSSAFDKLAIALLVALVVRWLNLLLESSTPKADIYASSFAQMMKDIKVARRRLWVGQNWLPDGESHGDVIAKTSVPTTELRFIVASLRHDGAAREGIVSPVYARYRGRPNLDLDDVKTNIKQSIQSFVTTNKIGQVRFNFGHLPGWIVIIDDIVYWGPTPIHESNWANDLYFHRADVGSEWGHFWKEQFVKLWEETTHTIEHELAWNEKLTFATPKSRSGA